MVMLTSVMYVKLCAFVELFSQSKSALLAVLPDWASYWTFGNFSKSLATINLPKCPAFLGNFYKVVKIFHFSCEIIFGQLL